MIKTVIMINIKILIFVTHTYANVAHCYANRWNKDNLKQDHLIHIFRAANLKCFTSIIYKYADEDKQPTWTWNK